MVSTPGGNASFTCFLTQPPQGPVQIQWVMNGSAALLNETIEQGNAYTTMPGDNLWELHLVNLSTQINISCSFSYSAENITSSPVSLNLQGIRKCGVTFSSLRDPIEDKVIANFGSCPFCYIKCTHYRSSLCCWLSDVNHTGIHHLPQLDSSLHFGYTKC